MKTIKICYDLEAYSCPNCSALYFKEVECNCPNNIIIPIEETFEEKEERLYKELNDSVDALGGAI